MIYLLQLLILNQVHIQDLGKLTGLANVQPCKGFQ